ncbi:MAG: agmatinase family protein [Verrucomicrobia bacterium]|jgi:agmatinase|nr:agmatinase family protein [Verrucomicrobiota bacterium]
MVPKDFDPNGVGIKGTLFGLPVEENGAAVVVLPVPWEVTVSYGEGTSKGPNAVLEASAQLDLADPDFQEAWRPGYVLKTLDQGIQTKSDLLRKKAASYIQSLEEGNAPNAQEPIVKEANEAGLRLKESVKSETLNLLKAGKIPALLGGDHSCPLGLIEAIGEHYDDFGILQIDAHADLRPAYEGFQFSHASIMWNALEIPTLSNLTQVSIRDLCQQELEVIHQNPNRIHTFFDASLNEAMYDGKTWNQCIAQIIELLPQHVYLSFDIDGLDPKLCPNTGTPVPGGLEFGQAVSLIKSLVKSGRTIVGFDLCEVSPRETEWDANVGARILYKLCCWAAASQKKLKLTDA